MTLNPNNDGEAPPDFMAALYGEDSEEQMLDEELDEVIKELDEDLTDAEDAELDAWSPIALSYSPLTSPERRGSWSPSSEPYLGGSPQAWRSRSPARSSARRSRSPARSSEPYLGGSPQARRSRSPARSSEPLGVNLGVYDEAGLQIDVEDYYAPDSHALYDSTGLIGATERGVIDDEMNGSGRRRSVRGRGRGVRRGRSGRGGHAINRGQLRQGRGGGRRRQVGWQPGQPLEEIWLTDDDVPLQLREMARDVVRRRQARVQVLERQRRTHARNLNEGETSESENDDVFEDAIDGRDNTLLVGEDLHFEWSSMETFRSVEETFIPERTGSVSSYTNPYDAFRSFWGDDILQSIVDETNRYASRITSATFQADWYPTNAAELLCLFAFWMMTGVIRMPTICSYFSTNSLLKTEVFSRMTTLKRYTNLNRALHFVDTPPTTNANPTADDAASSDRVHLLRPIIDHLNRKFQSNYVLSKDICIDESLTLWKGRLNMKQYIRSKAAKFGIKTFELCESATGYLWSFLVYTGKESSLGPELAKSTAVVRKLIQPLLNKGYRLFMDNWFNSPYLARYLKRSGTDCVGTLRASRVDVPRLVANAPLKQGQLVARHSGDVCVLSWMDKQRITMISTCHGAATGLPRVSSCKPQRPELFKPQSILDYNRSMGGVDLKDQMLEPYLLERKRGAKWYIKLFKRLLNVSIHNSRVLLESSLKVRQDNLKFRLELVHAILDHHHSLIPKNRRAESSHRSNQAFPHIVQHAHWPVYLPQSDADKAKNRRSRQKCVICLQEGRKLQKTTFMCESCKVPLCVTSCFKKYHTSI